MTLPSMKSCAARPRPGSEARPKSAFRAASIRIILARPILAFAALSRRRSRICTFTRSRRLEVTQGAATLGMPIRPFLTELKAVGLGTLPGTAAEILDDEVRAVICADKVNTAQWLDVARTAHSLGLRTTSTIMYGHIEHPVSWARHLMAPAGFAGGDGRLHRVRALALRAQGSPDLSQGRGSSRADSSERRC